MIRSMLAVAAGYISISFLNGFSHAVTSLYFRHSLSLTGVPACLLPLGDMDLRFYNLFLDYLPDCSPPASQKRKDILKF